jgi:hypothetical protein
MSHCCFVRVKVCQRSKAAGTSRVERHCLYSQLVVMDDFYKLDLKIDGYEEACWVRKYDMAIEG